MAGPISLGTALNPNPQVRRDLDAVDIGAHYEALDFYASGIDLSAPLTLSGGVAISVGGDYAFNVLSGAQIAGTGAPIALNRICYHGNVQEQPPVAGTAKFLNLTNVINTSLAFRFTDFSMPPGQTSVPLIALSAGVYPTGELWFRDCQIRGGGLALTFASGAGTATLALTNNLLERCTMALTRNGGTISLYQYNNLFHGGSLALTNNSSPNTTWYVRDTAPQSKSGTQIDSANNAFAGVTDGLSTLNPRNLTSADYVTGPLGFYYYPTSGANLFTLVDAGSRTVSDATLFHYTVRTDQAKDTGSVAIGYHYVALDATGNPKDSDSDSTPDVLEDLNGNGIADSGETDWQTYNSPNGLSSGSGLQVFTPWK